MFIELHDLSFATQQAENEKNIHCLGACRIQQVQGTGLGVSSPSGLAGWEKPSALSGLRLCV